MRRREFLAALAGASALHLRVASAQQTETARRIGVLLGWPDGDPTFRDWAAAFVEELARLGWVDRGNAAIEILWTNADINRASLLAKELIASQPGVLLGGTTSATAALQKETSTIPIVFAAVSDPAGSGFVASFAHPGGNITGFTNSVSHGKLFDLVKQIAPGVTRGGIIFNPDTAPGGGSIYLPSFQAAARSLGDEPMILPVHSDAEIESAIAALGREQGGLVVMADVFVGSHMGAIIAATLRNKVPAIFQDPYFPARGGLLSYGPDEVDIFRRAASYVDRVLRGERAADLPVQGPTKFNMTINLKTAQALGLTVPPALLASADEVIE